MYVCARVRVSLRVLFLLRSDNAVCSGEEKKEKQRDVK